MTCAAARQTPKLVLHGRDLALVSPELPEWDEYPRSAPWRLTTLQLLCIFGVGFCLGFLTLALLIGFLGPHS